MIGDGERFKSLKTAEKVLSFLIESRFERTDAIVGFGGGVGSVSLATNCTNLLDLPTIEFHQNACRNHVPKDVLYL